MSIGHPFVAAAVARVLIYPAAVSAYTLTTGRLWAIVATLLALAGVVIGGRALAQPTARSGRGKQRAILALVVGLAGALIGGLVVAAADGGPGTGYGIVGGFVGLVIGLIALILGALALARSRRSNRVAS